MQSGLTSAGAIVATAALRSHIAGAALPPLMTDLGADEIPRRPLGNAGIARLGRARSEEWMRLGFQRSRDKVFLDEQGLHPRPR